MCDLQLIAASFELCLLLKAKQSQEDKGDITSKLTLLLLEATVLVSN